MDRIVENREVGRKFGMSGERVFEISFKGRIVYRESMFD